MTSKHLVVVGISHLHTHQDVRALVAVAPGELESALSRIRFDANLSEVVILSTCSRVEVYAVAEDPNGACAALTQWFAHRANKSPSALTDSIYQVSGMQALQHLFRVAAGLDSWIIGESEILAQVKNAYQAAFEQGLTDRVLNRVFQRAIAAGKMARSQTRIQEGVHSIGGAAALLARKIFGIERDSAILVFGAGAVAETVVRHLAAKEFHRIFVSNRTIEKARSLADSLGGQALNWEDGFGGLARASMAVFSLSCQEAVLDSSRLRTFIENRQTPLFLLDLGLPRNVAEDCRALPGVTLYDLDQLEEMVRESLKKKQPEKEKAEVLVSIAAAECREAIDQSSLTLAQAVTK